MQLAMADVLLLMALLAQQFHEVPNEFSYSRLACKGLFAADICAQERKNNRDCELLYHLFENC